MDPIVKEWLPIVADIVTSLIAVIAVVVAIWSNVATQKRYRDSLAPKLSMSLERNEFEVYLIVKNVGGSAAKEICLDMIAYDKITEYHADEVREEYRQRFNGCVAEGLELYPQEIIQCPVVVGVKNKFSIETALLTTMTFQANYVNERNKKFKYTRKLTLSNQHIEIASVHVGIEGMGEIIKHSMELTNNTLRIANYLDGGNKILNNGSEGTAGTEETETEETETETEGREIDAHKDTRLEEDRSIKNEIRHIIEPAITEAVKDRHMGNLGRSLSEVKGRVEKTNDN